MPKYKVKENNEVQYGADKAKGIKAKIAKPGDVIELTVEEAAVHSHALELSDAQAAKLEKIADPNKK